MTDKPNTEDAVYSWETGMPTKPDVDALMKYWPEPKVGDVMTYDDVSVLIGCDWKSARFKSVTQVWRNRMQEKGVILECRAGEAFYVASADQVSANTYGVLSSIGRKARVQRKKLSVVPVENEFQRDRARHQGQLLHAIEQDAKKKRMNILPNTKPAEAPRLGPPAPPPGKGREQVSDAQIGMAKTA